MSSRRARLAAAAAVLCAGSTIAPPAASGAATWRLEQPLPPAGAPFAVPLGAPGDIRFNGVSRGLMSVEGNATVARGLYFYDGVRWRPLATVCGGSGDTSRVAWAGPAEFWTITEPSRPRAGSGLALCHIKDGVVVGSYSTADSAADPYRQMVAAACDGPSDCWFGGVGSRDALGQRVGAFHARWDGGDVRTVYAPQGRGVSGIAALGGGRFVETTFVGRARENRVDPVDLARPEDPGPRILHTIGPGGFRNEPFVAAERPGLAAEATELLAVDVSGENVWAAGGGAASGPAAPPETSADRPPIAVRRAGDFWHEVALDETKLHAGELITAIAALPGSADAMAAVSTFADRRSTTAKARVARLSPSGEVSVTTLPASGAGRGSAARIACPAPDECWMATTAGWLFHMTDGSQHAQTTDPAFARLITRRPNEAAEQFIPDAPPVDDSLLFAPPPAVEEAAAPATTETGTQAPPKPKPVITKVRKPRLRSPTRMVVAFTVVRTARIGMVGYRGPRVVTRAKARLLKPGKRTLVLKLSRKRSRYPTRLKFTVSVPGEQTGDGTGDGDVVTTGDTATGSATTAPPEPTGSGGTTIGLGARPGRRP